jgi:hypothetical protein
MATKKAPAKKPRKQRVAPAKDRLTAMGIEAVCNLIAECEPLHQIADAAGVSKGTLIAWLAAYPDHYARAKEAQADRFAEEILAIADEEVTMVKRSKHQYGAKPEDDDETNEVEVVFDPTAVARNRLRVDARKWLASKMAPKKYGDKLAVGGADDLPPLQSSLTVEFVGVK